MIDSKITWHLDNWAEWMRHGSGCAPGYSSRASGGMGKSGSQDFDSMVAEVDVRCAQAVDAVVRDLPQVHRLALGLFYFEEKYSDVYRFRYPPEVMLEQAREKVGRELERRGIV